MLEAEPAYANLAPNFKTVFNGLKNQNPGYIAHEYLNLDWDLMYFSDVAQLSQSAKLDFAISAVPIDSFINYLGKKINEFLQKVTNPIMREQIKDYFINRQFRKDIYVRGARKLSAAEIFDKVFSIRYILTRPAAVVPMKMAFYTGEINFNENIYKPLLEYLQEDNFRPKDLKSYLTKTGANPQQLLEVICMLVHGNNILPCQSESAVKIVKKSCERLNNYICERSKFGDAINFLASPLTGGGVGMDRFQQLFLLNYKAGERSAEKLAASLWKILSEQGQKIIVEDKSSENPSGRKLLETPEENLAHLKNLAEDFLSKQLPIYKALLL